MSQVRVTLPITIGDLYSGPASTEPLSLRDARENPDTARFRFVHREVPRQDKFGLDPWELRDTFITWDLEYWEGFFEMAGAFGGGVYITRRDFAEWQRLMKAAVLLPASQWETLACDFDPKKVAKLRGVLPIRWEWSTDPPAATLYGLTPLGTMIAAIQLDKLQGAEFRVCARADCKSSPFKVGTRQKIYCSSECAHLVAVRNSRARAVDNKAARKPKTRRQTSKR